MYVLVGILLIFAVLSGAIGSIRKWYIRRKISKMTEEQKIGLLEQVGEPFGYCYEGSQDIFSSTIDAWQRDFGYMKAFDRYASHFNLVFDCEPIYFDYDGKTWLIELWKGQYGINTGCEIGIYRADTIIPERQRKTTRFQSVPNEEMMCISAYLYRKGKYLADLQKRHWWLTIFDMGIYTQPRDLSMRISITFPDNCMQQAFVQALEQKGYNLCDICLCRTTVSFRYDRCSTCRANILHKFIMWLAQIRNHFLCWLYLCVTRPFTTTRDRMLCLYFFLPFAFRRTLRCGRLGKKKRCKV